VNDFWILIVDKKTNEIKVLIWWNNYFWTDWQVNSVLALRQPWSTIKPFNYILAFKNFWLNWDSKIIDEPIQFFTEANYAYTPKNYSLKYKWEVSLKEALSQSLNIPAVKILEKVWVQNLLDFLRKLWITSLKENVDFYWLSLTLWSWEINLFELLQAYTIFSNNWDFCEFIILKWEEKKCRNIIEKKYTDEIIKILSDWKIKLEEFPINWNLDFWDEKVFVKTWTSRNFRDNWTIWFTEKYLIWVWVWNKDWSPMKWVSWATWAWDIFNKIVKNFPSNFVIPAKAGIQEEYENPSTSSGWQFINLGLQNIKWEDKNNNYIQIISPLSWSIYQIEKNKDLENQKIKLDFFTNIDFDEKKWFINWKEYKENFWKLEEWKIEIEIKIFKNWEKINWEKIFVEVLN